MIRTYDGPNIDHIPDVGQQELAGGHGQHIVEGRGGAGVPLTAPRFPIGGLEHQNLVLGGATAPRTHGPGPHRAVVPATERK